MENQNLIFQVSVPVPVDQVAEAHPCIIKSIQNNTSGAFTLEERGKIISYVITNPAAAATYEQLLSDDELSTLLLLILSILCFWLNSS